MVKQQKSARNLQYIHLHLQTRTRLSMAKKTEKMLCHLRYGLDHRKKVIKNGKEATHAACQKQCREGRAHTVQGGGRLNCVAFRQGRFVPNDTEKNVILFPIFFLYIYGSGWNKCEQFGLEMSRLETHVMEYFY